MDARQPVRTTSRSKTAEPGAMSVLDVVAAATVKIHTQRLRAARGVLVAGGYILTAAHCIEIDGAFNDLFTGMAQGDSYRVSITTASGLEIATDVCMLEPVSDLAVLAPIDRDNNPYQAGRFVEFVQTTRPLPLAPCLPPQRYMVWPKELPVRLAGKGGAWINAKAQRFDSNSRTEVTATRPVPAVAVGGPIVDTRGRLVAVVSETQDPAEVPAEDQVTMHPLVAACLPAWLLKNMTRSAKK
jgi:hypothetical protein